MTLEQLRMLVTIADVGGILSAAEKLHKTQPTISVAMKKLEEEMGLKILSRDAYRASLTSAGEALCRQARVILKQSQIFSEMAKHLARGNEPEVRIAIEASCPLDLVLETLAKCEKKFPGTQFNLMGETLWGALDRLQKGEADLAISPWFEENLEFEAIPITSATLVAIASPAFRNHLETGALTLNDLQNSVQVVVRDSSREPRPQNFGYLPEGRHWYVTDHFTKKEIILAGMGWGRLHEHLIAEELNSGKLVRLNIRNYQSTLDINICVARIMDKPAGPVAENLWQEFSRITNH
ncbi:MAG TPA: LysR family transcriptional regulator [Desulfuromonadales bacterium]|nr:LysR family transcriptional regulator [Desulfuromonadales bacterium]